MDCHNLCAAAAPGGHLHGIVGIIGILSVKYNVVSELDQAIADHLGVIFNNHRSIIWNLKYAGPVKEVVGDLVVARCRIRRDLDGIVYDGKRRRGCVCHLHRIAFVQPQLVWVDRDREMLDAVGLFAVLIDTVLRFLADDLVRIVHVRIGGGTLVFCGVAEGGGAAVQHSLLL